MNRLKQLKKYPFGLFLCLEWILLGAAIFGESTIAFLDSKLNHESLFPPIISLFCLIALGLVGLRLPQNNIVCKWIYTFWQIGLLCLLSLSDRVFYIPHLIIVIRSCLIFKKKERLLATTLTIITNVTLFTLKFPDFQRFRQNDEVTIEQFVAIKSVEIGSHLFLSAFFSAVLFLLVNTLIREYKSRQKLRGYAILLEVTSNASRTKSYCS